MTEYLHTRLANYVVKILIVCYNQRILISVYFQGYVYAMNAITDARYNLGIAYLEDAQYGEAVTEFKAVLRLDSDHIDAHCGLSRAYLEQNELDMAETSALAALRVDSDYVPARTLIDSIKSAFYEKGISKLKQNQYEDAVRTFRKIVEEDSEFQHVHYNLGLAFIGLKEYKNGIDSLLTALDSDTVHDDIHLQLGLAYIEVKQFEDAIRYLKQALDSDPNLIEVHYNLARAYSEIGNLEAATNEVTETLRLDPVYAPIQGLVENIKQTHYNRGVTFQNEEHFSDAVTSFQNATLLDADFTAAHYNLGMVLLKMEQYSRSVEALRKTVELDRTHKAAFHALALAYFGQHEVEKARKAAQNALEIDPNFQAARTLLEAIDPSFSSSLPSQTVETQARPQPDIDATNNKTPVETKQAQIIDSSNERQDVENGFDQESELKKIIERGMIYLGSRQYKQASAAFKKALKADPNCVDAHYGLGKTYFETGAFDDAISAAEEALRLNPQHIHSQDLLQMIQYVTELHRKQKMRKKVFIFASVFSIIVFGLFVAYRYGMFSRTVSDDVNHLDSVNTNDDSKPKNRTRSVPVINVSLDNRSGDVNIFAGEEETIRLMISNKGDTLNNVKVDVNSEVEGISFALPETISRISKDQSREIEVRIAANDNVKTQKLPLEINLEQRSKRIASTDVQLSIIGTQTVR